MKVFATYARRSDGEWWRLAAVSVVSPERARALAEREQVRPDSPLSGAALTVREFDSLQAVPWRLEAAG